MSSIKVLSTVDPYIQRLKDSRNKNAVLKYRLAMLRSHFKDIPVLAFEGPEDKIIYFHWFKRIRPDFTYEPFPCSGKKQVLRFREMLSRDLGGIKNQVYFIIDRDFDDLAGFPEGEDLFMTDFYATENYLVHEGVLSELLKIEYHCHGRPDVRQIILNNFRSVYLSFLNETRDINKRLFIAKMLGIELRSHIPQKLNEIATVELGATKQGPNSAENIVQYMVEPSAGDIDAISAEFDKLDPPTRFRGKFALQFFFRWLDLLADDYEREPSRFFDGIDRSFKVLKEEITLGNLASKSQFPNGLANFVSSIAHCD